MSYEDLEEARAKRAANEKATASKGERGSCNNVGVCCALVIGKAK
jgi:hypothetical protein